jgi:hypothetical protein
VVGETRAYKALRSSQVSLRQKTFSLSYPAFSPLFIFYHSVRIWSEVNSSSKKLDDAGLDLDQVHPELLAGEVLRLAVFNPSWYSLG